MPMDSGDRMDFDLRQQLGATEQPSPQRLTLYIPNKDRDGVLLTNHEQWAREAQELLTEIGDGATAFPPVDGTWRKPDGSYLWEQTKIIYTYIDPDKFAAKLPQLRSFLHRFGRETNQGVVVFEFEGWMWRISQYDPPNSA
jgi:hypothetical protein